MVRVGSGRALVFSLAASACVLPNPAFDVEREALGDEGSSGESDDEGESDADDEGHSSGGSTGDGDGEPISDDDGELMCGDGIVDPGEECDLGPHNDDLGECTQACKLATCGDGFTQTVIGEGCDLGPDNGGGGPCRGDCQVNVCGDNYLGPGEACEVEQDGCTQDCKLPSCGDGILDPGEACDDGNETDEDSCTNACTLPVCGDGYVQADEQCDDGNPHNDDECTTTCKLAACGDGHIHAGVEECDSDNLAGRSCADFDFLFGQLQCNECAFDLSQCLVCMPIGGPCQSTADCCKGAVLSICLNFACVSL